jgi:hypothetical protein
VLFVAFNFILYKMIRSFLFQFAFLIVVCLSITTSLRAQSAVDKLIPKTIMPSPNVAGLGKYGDYNVSFYTGLPEISIPIFEAKSGSLAAPITLSYHASGIRYNDQSSWVGLGWSLSCGGQISRSNQGAPDEEYYSTHALLNDLSVCTNYAAVLGIADGTRDNEPDIFSYGYPGKSGKFMLGPGGTAPYLFPYEPIIVAPQLGFPQIPKINITGEDGTFYRFGENALGETARELTNSTNGGNTKTAMTSWYLMEMAAANSNDKITFTYESIGSSHSEDINQSLTVCDQLEVDGCPTLPTTMAWNSDSPSSSDVINVLGIKTIIFDGGKVEFLTTFANRNDQSSKALEFINIYSELNGVYTLVKSVKFIYSYYNTNLRLKLDQVLFLDAQGNTVERYAFTYFSNNFSWDTPTKSKKRDYWGFYNGRASNPPSLIPQTIIDFQAYLSSSVTPMTIGSADRTTDTIYCKEGLLQRIDFPTGGYTIFDFEPHKYQESGVPLTPVVFVFLRLPAVQGQGFNRWLKLISMEVTSLGLALRTLRLTSISLFLKLQRQIKVIGPVLKVNMLLRIY